MQTLLLVKITTLLEQKKKTFSLRLKQIYSIISPNKNNKECIRSVQKLECDPEGNIGAGFPYNFFFCFFSGTLTLIQLLALADMNQKGKACASNEQCLFFFCPLSVSRS